MSVRRLDSVTYQRIAAIILCRVGAHNAIRGSEIVEIMRLAGHPIHLRRVGEAVAWMREEGDAVCSSSSRGYWIAATADEREATATEIRRRIASEVRALAAFDRSGAARIQIALPLRQAQPSETSVVLMGYR